MYWTTHIINISQSPRSKRQNRTTPRTLHDPESNKDAYALCSCTDCSCGAVDDERCDIARLATLDLADPAPAHWKDSLSQDEELFRRHLVSTISCSIWNETYRDGGGYEFIGGLKVGLKGREGWELHRPTHQGRSTPSPSVYLRRYWQRWSLPWQ